MYGIAGHCSRFAIAPETEQETIDPYLAAKNDLIDDVIDPRETRPTIIRGLRMAADKRVERPWRKHGVMPV